MVAKEEASYNVDKDHHAYGKDQEHHDICKMERIEIIITITYSNNQRSTLCHTQ